MFDGGGGGAGGGGTHVAEPTTEYQLTELLQVVAMAAGAIAMYAERLRRAPSTANPQDILVWTGHVSEQLAAVWPDGLQVDTGSHRYFRSNWYLMVATESGPYNLSRSVQDGVPLSVALWFMDDLQQLLEPIMAVLRKDTPLNN